MRAFISYASEDKIVADKIKSFLETFSIQSFIAHEDINGGSKWRQTLFKELKQADTFVSILSNLNSI